MKNQHLHLPDSPPAGLLLNYLDGAGTDSERQAIRARIQESETWRREFAQAQHFRQGFCALPNKKPPQRVWAAVAQAIENTPQQTVWFPWFYANTLWTNAVRVLPVFLVVFLTVTYLWMGESKSPYHVVVMSDSNGFGLEAESYVAHHALSAEPALTRETLVAYYTYNWPE
ncbi:MAG: hypothetical protein RBU29_01425 [bacterium]|jgi:anti-sigma factor RsiW|nr:hypothetical protein [bacterium]